MSFTVASYCLVSILLLVVYNIDTSCAEKTCYARDDNPYLYFSTKTAYEFVKDKARSEDVPYCEPKQLWLMARHGTRYPSRNRIIEMKLLTELRNQIVRNHEDRRDGLLCDQDLENLKKWNLEVSITQSEDLSKQGHTDMEFIARRYKSRFSGLLTRSYKADLFDFRHTDTQRAKASAEAFAYGMFGNAEGSHNLPPPVSYSPLLESYKNCSTWKQRVADNPRTASEREMFINGSLLQNIKKRISARLGFKYNLTMRQIDQMYDMCRYDKAWEINELSAWCAVFLRNELQVLEYKEDLYYYYKVGYGNEINAKLGCLPVTDLVNRFSALEDDNSTRQQPHGVFYFTHSNALATTLVALGIAKDFPKLLHNNYEMMLRREWKTSQILPFASNLGAVFFQCSRGDPHRVMFFLQERVVPYEGCDVGLCSWQYIKEKLSKLNRCNLAWCAEGYSHASVAKSSCTVGMLLGIALVALKLH